MSNAYLESMVKAINRYCEIVNDYENEKENEIDFWRITEYYDNVVNVRYEVTKKNGKVIEIRIMNGETNNET